MASSLPGDVGATALIVEDERVVALDLKRSLERRGYRTSVTVSSGAEAVCAVEVFTPDIVLMNLRLKGLLDGIATALCLRQRFEFALIYVTGQDASSVLQDAERLRQSNPDAWLLKPYTLQQLDVALSSALARRRNRAGT